MGEIGFERREKSAERGGGLGSQVVKVDDSLKLVGIGGGFGGDGSGKVGEVLEPSARTRAGAEAARDNGGLETTQRDGGREGMLGGRKRGRGGHVDCLLGRPTLTETRSASSFLSSKNQKSLLRAKKATQ